MARLLLLALAVTSIGLATSDARPPASAWPHGYVAMCLCIKNQHEDVFEWVQYHRHIGAAKVYVYDNDSQVTQSHGSQLWIFIAYTCIMLHTLACRICLCFGVMHTTHTCALAF